MLNAKALREPQAVENTQLKQELARIDAELERLQHDRLATELRMSTLRRARFLVLTRHIDDTGSGDPGYFFRGGEIICVGSENGTFSWDDGNVEVVVGATVSVRTKLAPASDGDWIENGVAWAEANIGEDKVTFDAKHHGWTVYGAQIVDDQAHAERLAREGYRGGWDEGRHAVLKTTPSWWARV